MFLRAVCTGQFSLRRLAISCPVFGAVGGLHLPVSTPPSLKTKRETHGRIWPGPEWERPGTIWAHSLTLPLWAEGLRPSDACQWKPLQEALGSCVSAGSPDFTHCIPLTTGPYRLRSLTALLLGHLKTKEEYQLNFQVLSPFWDISSSSSSHTTCMFWGCLRVRGSEGMKVLLLGPFSAILGAEPLATCMHFSVWLSESSTGFCVVIYECLVYTLISTTVQNSSQVGVDVISKLTAVWLSFAIVPTHQDLRKGGRCGLLTSVRAPGPSELR